MHHYKCEEGEGGGGRGESTNRKKIVQNQNVRKKNPALQRKQKKVFKV